MDAAKQWTFALERFVAFSRDVLEPAIYANATPLSVRVFQTAEPVAYAGAVRARYKPVDVGFTWGPRWSTAWFHVRGRVPRRMRGERVLLRFSTDTEALVWTRIGTAGVPLHGLDANRDAVTLQERAAGGERVDLHVEAACNHLFGDRGLQWDPPEIHRRWNSPRPGLLERCELATLNAMVWRLHRTYAFALDLARQSAPDSARGRQLLGALRRATNMLPDDGVAAAAPGALRELERAIGAPAGGSATVCHAVGHAHIDTAWLWPVRETKRKLLRTFSTALRNMERFPDYPFLCSQAQQYAWVEERSPELFAQIRRRVAQGRWEPGGAMWVEPDCTCPSGESLVRQILHADRYWRSRFGDRRGRQSFLYLPDTFGFPAQLPQIMRLAGLDTFITNKLHWNSRNEFPFTTWVWRGLDGSEVLAHNTPGMDYNATMSPRELVRGEKTHKNKDLAGAGGVARWLQPFGFGDGGGGPTDWQIEHAGLARDCDGLPRVRFSSVREFCDALHADVAFALRRDPHAVPAHEGELYLELHRGTYTTHARAKQANAVCEGLLRQAEVLSFAGPRRLSRPEERAARAELDRAWKLLLLNQFHDILPGSSIGLVYEDAARDLAEVERIATGLIDRGIARWAGAMGTASMRRPTAFFSPLSMGPQERVRIGGKWREQNTLALDLRVIDAAEPAEKPEDPVVAREDRLENRSLALRFDAAGRIASFRKDGREFRTRGPLNQLVLYEDRPRLWDAWDIDEEYAQKAEPAEGRASRVRVVERGPAVGAVEFERALGRRSRATVRYTLHAESEHLEITLGVDWQEQHRLLRALFPFEAVGGHAVFGTQMGYRLRAMRANTSHEAAAFEVPVHRFVAVPTADWGRHAAVVLDGIYGASCRAGEIGVSLLRSSRYPDPEADVGRHVLRYGLRVDRGADDVSAEAETFVRRPIVREVRPARGSIAPARWRPFELDALRGSIHVECFKIAEDSDRLILRLAEHRGQERTVRIGWNLPVRSVEPVDLLERPMALRGLRHERRRGRTTVRFRPFQIVTLQVERAD